jgi:sec-independent protein translocase protein TatB
MFGIGFSEIVIIVLVVIVFVRPADLPAFMRKLGKLYGEAKRAYNEIISFKNEFMREMDVAAALKEAERRPEKTAGETLQPPPQIEAPITEKDKDEEQPAAQE